jgi:isoprenylcysteine carboxyl methyltransferase (ICMT) family protein YpbQ
MSPAIIAFILFVFLFRFATLILSIRHEEALKQTGAVEYGAANSKLLALAHVLFLTAVAAEGIYRAAPIDNVSIVGFVLYGISVISMLTVIRLLGPLWTVKLLIARNHSLVRHPLFRIVRHPNYYLNILPELIGFALALHAYATLIIGLPLYLIPLITRIRQEEAAMRQKFTSY